MGIDHMDILYRASTGTMESSDAYVEIGPGENGIHIELGSVVQAQFGDAIHNAYRPCSWARKI